MKILFLSLYFLTASCGQYKAVNLYPSGENYKIIRGKSIFYADFGSYNIVYATDGTYCLVSDMKWQYAMPGYEVWCDEWYTKPISKLVENEPITP